MNHKLASSALIISLLALQSCKADSLTGNQAYSLDKPDAPCSTRVTFGEYFKNVSSEGLDRREYFPEWKPDQNSSLTNKAVSDCNYIAPIILLNVRDLHGKEPTPPSLESHRQLSVWIGSVEPDTFLADISQLVSNYSAVIRNKGIWSISSEEGYSYVITFWAPMEFYFHVRSDPRIFLIDPFYLDRPLPSARPDDR